MPKQVIFICSRCEHKMEGQETPNGIAHPDFFVLNFYNAYRGKTGSFTRDLCKECMNLVLDTIDGLENAPQGG